MAVGGEPIHVSMVEGALARLESPLTTLFETAEDAIFLVKEFQFVDCNPATLRMFGCRTKDEIIGRTPVDFSPERQPDGALSDGSAVRLVAAAKEGIPQRFEWRHCKLDRTEFEVEVRLNRCWLSGAVFVVGVVRDISDRKRAEAALRRQLSANDLIKQIFDRWAGSTPSQFDEDVDDTLRRLSAFLGADHAYFFTTSPDRTKYSCTHETCHAGITGIRTRFHDIPVASRTWVEPTLLAGKTARIDRLEGAPMGRGTVDEVVEEDPGRRSLLLVPTVGMSGALAGAIGVDSHQRPVSWQDTDVTLCSVVGNALTAMTERRLAAENLVREKQLSDRLIDCLPGAFYLYDSNLRLRRWNKSHESKTGYSAAELRGKTIEDWPATENDRAVVKAGLERVLDRGETAQIEVGIRNKDGSVTPYLLSGARIDSPEGKMFVGVGVDITARVEAEKALAASERNYRALFDATNDGLFICNEAGLVLEVNERARAMFGFDRSRVGQATITDLSGAPPSSRMDAISNIRRAIEEGPQTFDWPCTHTDGTPFWTEIALRAFTSDGETRVIASIRDITDRKRAALERERLMAECRAANEAKDQFLAVLSHELRTPLAAIQAGTGLLRCLGAADHSRAVRTLDAIERNVTLQTRFVNDLLDLSRLARGKLTVERAPTQLGEIVLDAAESCRTQASRSGITLAARAEPGIWVDADPTRLQQIVINLIENGLKFTRKGGQVTLSITAKDGEARLVVEDTGAGIEPNRLADIFDMFKQGRTGTQRAPGLGIGLALVKSLVELHGGTVWAESDGPGLGSRFIVHLPRCKAPEICSENVAAAPIRPRIRVLLVEDNDDIRTMLAETLAHLQYEVLAASTGEAALDLLARGPVDAIISDVGLPGIDGYEFLRRARSLTSAAAVPAFALTGFGQERDARCAAEAGFVEHLVKPVDVHTLDQRIRATLPAPKSDTSGGQPP